MVCLTGNIAKKNCGYFYRRTLHFLQKNVMSGIFPYNLQWVVQAVNKCNQNRETKCVDRIKLRNAFTDPL